MKKQVICLTVFPLLCILIIFLSVEAQTCSPSGKIKGKTLPSGQCNQENGSDYCKDGKWYMKYKCSPLVSSQTKATLTLNSFERDGDGGAPSECDNQYHSDDDPVVALSTGWYNNEKRCLNYINIHSNGKSVRAKVVDECDSTMRCYSDHDYQPLALTTLLMPRKQFGRLLECLRATGAGWISTGLILINHFIHIYIYNVCTRLKISCAP
ncbi:hypothetical protein ES288_A05G334200v1 [Gossypium darwinii]|uniref:Uncharacterized protein n=1 Tax=Gossypium darwinii TaxID=34276 RepID=A0A5D2GNV8_GOSDA|nr:hypothetical protein ES288_A05G334200v1 [Gossypium darwinii]